VRALSIAAGLALAAPAFAQNGQFDVGNLVVSQVGLDGNSTALNSAATAVVLKEFSVSGLAFTGDNAFMPTSAVGNNHMLTTSGSATSEGFLSLSADRQHLAFQGYDAAVGTAGIAASTVNRVLARVDLNMAIDTTTALTDGTYSGNNIRASYLSGSTFYATGAAGGVRSVAFGGNSSTAESGTLANARVVNIFNGNVYSSSASGAFVGINLVGGNTATLAIATGSGSSPYDFVFTDPNTCYIADDRATTGATPTGGLQKWVNSGGTWTLAYTMGVPSLTTGFVGLRGLTFDSAGGTFYATSTDNRIVSVVDPGNASATFTTLATAGTNTAFRGVEFIAAPAPGSLALLGLGGLLAARRRR
jgi:hypothetical protein